VFEFSFALTQIWRHACGWFNQHPALHVVFLSM